MSAGQQRTHGSTRRIARAITSLVDEVTLAFIFRIFAQAASFLLLARLLQPKGYGTLAALTGLVGLLVPFAGFGFGNLLARDIALTGCAVPSMVKRTYVLIALTLGPAAAVIGVVSTVVFGADTLPLVMLLCVAELGCNAATSNVASALLSYGQKRSYVWLQVVVSAGRLCAALILLTVPLASRSPTLWAGIYLIFTAIIFWWARSQMSRSMSGAAPDEEGQSSPPGILAGLSFSVGLATRTVYDDIDKVMLAHYRGYTETAVYAAAYRAVQAASSPSLALNAQLYPKYFQAGCNGPRAVIRLTKSAMSRTLLLAFAAVALVIIFRGVIATWLGAGYEKVPGVVAALAFLPVLQSIHFVLGDAVTGMGRQSARASAQVLSALLNAGLNLWLIPNYGVVGAILATAGSETALSFVLLLIWMRSLGGLETRTCKET